MRRTAMPKLIDTATSKATREVARMGAAAPNWSVTGFQVPLTRKPQGLSVRPLDLLVPLLPYVLDHSP
ncbi:MAG: hypothetical protein LJE70_14990 [Chromatiaceae bacterium]|nr:hypothetical protein [Chromatiaceae bacterium]